MALEIPLKKSNLVQKSILFMEPSEMSIGGFWDSFTQTKNHRKISGEYVIKIRCLTTLLSHAHMRDISRIQR